MDSSRPVTKAEEDFFSKVGTGKGNKFCWTVMVTGISDMQLLVPVIVVFTKFDAHDDEAYEGLKNEGISPDDAANQAQSRAIEDFQKTCMSLPIFTSNYPPKAYVILWGMPFNCIVINPDKYELKIDMNLAESHCIELVEKTAAALDRKALEALYVSTQRNEIELCFQFAMRYECRPCNCGTELNKNIEIL
jgi:hypothetical protein